MCLSDILVLLIYSWNSRKPDREHVLPPSHTVYSYFAFKREHVTREFCWLVGCFFFFPFSPQSPPVHSCMFLVVSPSSCGMWDAASAWPDEQCHARTQDSNRRNTGPPAAERANLTTRPRGQPLVLILFWLSLIPSDKAKSQLLLKVPPGYFGQSPSISHKCLWISPVGCFISHSVQYQFSSLVSLSGPHSLGTAGSSVSYLQDTAGAFSRQQVP